ncbi:diketogulonate reductase-like aldo/keto reductase [Ancylobacter aquaticus]|uniref:Diketogulonate reductase-like aldo/keto reductase n=1 Tax=Ancylobacter aquaticus TaxID=100 RepID=A0A4R1ICF6_ANCAQ|nr:aldo/keto reductase [Ancylobacter aquaticus]TCK31520.1 diketogulonate reductase-like aldo/keto reductase [Ancylobacter aquaticus]
MTLTRRSLMATAALGTAMLALPAGRVFGKTAPLARPIPSSGEQIPSIGLGSWITFNVGDDTALQAECTAVMAAFFAGGGRMIDSSPMYGSSQAVIGRGLATLGRPDTLFSAEKVWTSSGTNGPAQIEQTRRLWGVERFDLLQVHNLAGWEAHLDTLFAMKAAGRLRYVGITTSEGRRHDLVEQIMQRHPLDFVQLSYNPVDRDAEQRLLPLAAERGIAVIVNRPFQQGALTRRLDGEPLPQWAAEVGATSWAQLILKFILAEPAVTVVIPATTRVDHVRENLAAAGGALPDRDLRGRIAAHIGAL